MLIIAYIFAHVFHMPLNLESIADFVCKSPLRCAGDSYSIDVICFQCSIAAGNSLFPSLPPSLLHSNEHLQSLGQTFVLSLHNTRASWSSAGWPRAKKHGCNHAAQVKESIPLSEFGWAHGICENDLVNLLRRSLSKFFATCSRVRTDKGGGRGGEGNSWDRFLPINYQSVDGNERHRASRARFQWGRPPNLRRK